MSTSLVITTAPTLDDVLLSPEAVAKRWDIEVQTLANQRSKGKGPRYYKMYNGMIRYPDWAVLECELGKVKQ